MKKILVSTVIILSLVAFTNVASAQCKNFAKKII